MGGGGVARRRRKQARQAPPSRPPAPDALAGPFAPLPSLGVALCNVVHVNRLLHALEVCSLAHLLASHAPCRMPLTPQWTQPRQQQDAKQLLTKMPGLPPGWVQRGTSLISLMIRSPPPSPSSLIPSLFQTHPLRRKQVPWRADLLLQRRDGGECVGEAHGAGGQRKCAGMLMGRRGGEGQERREGGGRKRGKASASIRPCVLPALPPKRYAPFTHC